jgi:tetratricopeptide (TPR) repeat protein
MELHPRLGLTLMTKGVVRNRRVERPTERDSSSPGFRPPRTRHPSGMGDTMKKLALAFVALLLITLAAGPAGAATQARFSAVVLDSSGNPIPDAVVTITSPDQPTYKKVQEPNAKGEFRMLILDATKTYQFKVEAAGFQTHVEDFKISIGTMDNHFELVLKSLEEVSVAEQKSLLEQPGYKELDAGKKLAAAGQLEEAKAQFEASLAAMPDLLSARELLTRTLFDLEDHQAALDSAKICLDEDPESLGCLAVAVECSQALGDDEGHAAYLAQYQELNPDDPAAVFNQAAGFLNAMDDEKARPLLEECLDIDPEFPKCLFEYGMLLLRSGDLENAKLQLQKYLEVDPEGTDAATAAETIKYL